MRTCCILLLISTSAIAGHSLFDPVPPELLRELKPDRPYATSSPFTVDAGHLQIELDFFIFARDSGEQGNRNTRLRTFNLVPINLKLGLLPRLDFQVSFEPLRFERLEVFDPTTSIEREGFGDMVVRVKFNLWGNDDPGCAMAIMPWVKLPTSQDELGNEEFEGGVIVPYSRALGSHWTLGVQVRVDVVYNGQHVAAFGQSLYVQRDLLADLAAFVEVVSDFADGDWEGSVRIGGIYTVAAHFILDFGGAFALNDRAENSRIWVGATVRF